MQKRWGQSEAVASYLDDIATYIATCDKKFWYQAKAKN